MTRLILTLPLLALFQCDKDETVAAYGAADQIWVLQEIDGQPYEASALLRFPEEGRIAGNAPCNSYDGTLNAPYPWFEVQNLNATRAACAGLEAEGVYFAALMAMTQSEVSGNVLILRNEDGHEMVFTAAE
ncbi:MULTISPECIES: META domain-containing protein [unclassified Ruegeria]|uniref:META domain-containing protein n=1 Tax=unclassified Ruegeria TaxID=2625375 RepID=UPI001490DDA3|nr:MULTISPECIES: META domain-containing protein [unclassified Ruegeria]NOC47167.1 META domain-containing protein [Ruegeria sp. HKCCD7559]NOD86009.1 META domain-containing protein [Ruegeria sp. HKCCD6119]